MNLKTMFAGPGFTLFLGLLAIMMFGIALGHSHPDVTKFAYDDGNIVIENSTGTYEEPINVTEAKLEASSNPGQAGAKSVPNSVIRNVFSVAFLFAGLGVEIGTSVAWLPEWVITLMPVLLILVAGAGIYVQLKKIART